jgi:hypothetical protein
VRTSSLGLSGSRHPQGMARIQETTMKKLIAAAALATALATPAFAQSDPNMSSRPIVSPQSAPAPRAARQPNAAAFAAGGGGTMLWDGAVARDPDPNIQYQLHREADQGEW